MADTPITPTPVGSWPTAPQRTDAPATFVTRADAWVAATPTRSTEMNALATNVNFNATSAFDSAGEALSSSTASVAAANFQGAWSSLTGAFTVGHSVKHDGLIWIATTAIADVAAAEPGVSGDWDQIGGFIREERTANIKFVPIDSGKIIEYTSGSFTQTFDPAASLGDGWGVSLSNSGSGTITLDPDGSETIDGASSIDMPSGDFLIITCDGTNLYSTKIRTTTADNEVSLHTGNAYGSTNTKIRRFTTALRNVGSAITYADSSAAGASFTINEDGLYAVRYSDTFTTGQALFGVSLNSSQLTTVLTNITTADRLVVNLTDAGGGEIFNVSLVVRLSSGDVIRPHTSGNANPEEGADNNTFVITKVGI